MILYDWIKDSLEVSTDPRNKKFSIIIFLKWLRWDRPIRCINCKTWFLRGDFINPWGPRKGPGLACSINCAEVINPGCCNGI